jgi:uncharacterized protein (DUF362 family)
MHQHPCHKQHAHAHPTFSRRQFLGAMGMAAASLVAAGCGGAPASAPAVTGSTAAAPGGASPVVAIAEATRYDRAAIGKQVRDLIDAAGGLKGIVRGGDRVAIKINMTGGVANRPLPGVPAIESYITHPEVVRALAEAALDAGAKQIFLVEAAYEPASWTQWGFADIAKPLNAQMIDLNSTAPYSDFVEAPVGDGAFIYKTFTHNRILHDVDVFMSVPKMKCHNAAGITVSMKNLVGTVPARFYRLSEQDNYRSGFHGQSNETGTRLPRVIVDLNRARPIHFALVDGIKTTEGGEGPWINGMQAVTANVLIAGASPLATDAVAAAVMGFDPLAAAKSGPFVRSDNHLMLAVEKGLGTNRLDQIKVVGPAIADVMKKFKPSW